MNTPVLSLFPGIGLLDKAFEQAGFCVFRGPDLIWGGNIKDFFPEAGYFEGIIAGPPCQDFSVARAGAATGIGKEMIEETVRVIDAVNPDWALIENVPAVPDIHVSGYERVRFPLCAEDFGANMIRFRHFQFFWLNSVTECPAWPDISSRKRTMTRKKTVTGSTTVSWKELKELMGLPENYDLPGYTKKAKFQAVANGVHFEVGFALAEAIRDRSIVEKQLSFIVGVKTCKCGCGRNLKGRSKYFNQTCRKRIQRKGKRQVMF